MQALIDSPIKINAAGRVRCEPGWRLDWHDPDWLKDFDLWFVWAGRGRITLESGIVELRPGICIWMQPGRTYAAEQDPSDRLGVTYVHFDIGTSQPRQVGEAAWPEVNEVHDFVAFDAVSRRLVELSHGPAENAPLREIQDAEAGALLRSLLLALIAESRTTRSATGTGTLALHTQRIRGIVSGILERPGEVPEVRVLARANGYSPVHFARVFQTHTGQRPEEFIIGARLARARQLLRESTLSIGEIAAALGYADVFFFSRQFKQRTGMSPTQFRGGQR